ncbi:MAG: HAMP domain-containing protein [Anaerolineales bacterium]|nr:HAMP domain-containing protein [Anaerolineales bacterium]
MELKIIRRALIVFSILVLVLVVTAFFSAANLSRSTNITIDLISLQEVAQASGNITLAMEEERISIGQYPLSGDEELLNRLELAQADYNQNWNIIVENLGSQQPQLIADIETARETYQGMLDEMILVYQANPGDNTSSKILRDAINYYMQIINPKFNDLIKPELEGLARLTELERANAVTNSFVAQMVLVLSVVVGIVLIFVIIGAMVFSGRVLSSVTNIINAANAISRGDLDVPIDVDQAGEMGELAKAIDRMRISLKAAIERLRR